MWGHNIWYAADAAERIAQNVGKFQTEWTWTTSNDFTSLLRAVASGNDTPVLTWGRLSEKRRLQTNLGPARPADSYLFRRNTRRHQGQEALAPR